MDCRWLEAWAEFAQYVPPTKKAAIPENDNTDGEISSASIHSVDLDDAPPDPPGPVSTKDLFAADGTLLPNLRAKIDYRGVPPMVYAIFVELYGKDSSPEICRYIVDIYKAAVPDDKLVKIKLNAVVCLSSRFPPILASLIQI